MKKDHKDGIEVDENSRTSVPNIYAIGDVTNRVALTPVAIMEGMAFAKTVFGKAATPPDYRKAGQALLLILPCLLLQLPEKHPRVFRTWVPALSGLQSTSSPGRCERVTASHSRAPALCAGALGMLCAATSGIRRVHRGGSH